MACGAEQLGVGQRFAPAGTGAPASRAGGPAYLQDLTAGGSSQLEGDEDVGAEHIQHLHAGEDGGESVGQGQGVEGDAAQPGQHGQQRGGEQPGLPGPHQQGAEDADADLTCGGSRASRVGPAQPRPQHGHLTAGHGPAAPNEGGGFGGAPGEGTLSHRRDSNAPRPPEQRSGGAQPFPCKPWGMWGQGKALGLLGSPPLMPGMRSMVGNAARGPRKAQSPQCLLSTSRYGENAQAQRTCRSSLPHPQPCSRFPLFWCCLPHARDMDEGGAGMLNGSPPPPSSSPARAVAKRPNSATSLYTAPWNPRCSSWRTKSLHGERVSTTPTPTPPSQPRSSAQSALSALRTPPDCPIPTQGSPGPLVPRAEQQCGEQVEVEPDQGAHGQHQQHHAQNVSCTEGGWAYGQLGTPPAQRTRPSSPVQMEGCTPCPAPLTRHGRGE